MTSNSRRRIAGEVLSRVETDVSAGFQHVLQKTASAQLAVLGQLHVVKRWYRHLATSKMTHNIMAEFVALLFLFALFGSRPVRG